MKNLLIVIESLGTGGAEKALVNFIKRFYTRYNCYVLVYSEKDNYYARDIEMLATVRYVLPKYMRKMAKIVKYINPSLLYLSSVKRIFKDIEFDVELAYLEGIATKIVSGSNTNSKKIAWVHCDFSNNHWCAHYYKSYQEEKSSYKKFNSIFFVTERQKESFSRYWNIKEELYVIPNFLDINLIRELAEENVEPINRPYICAIGSLKPVKGFDLLIDAFFVFSKCNNDCHLYILGKGYLESKLKEKIVAYNLDKRVHIIGFQSNPYKYIKNSIGLIQTSRSESFGYVLLESAILGKRVVATKTVGAIEIRNKYYRNLELIDHNLSSIVDGLNYLNFNKGELSYKVSFSNEDIFNEIDFRLSN